MNYCEGCTLCCKLMGVDELEKPRDTWCKHCQVGIGCDIYETRPESCRIYECFWFKTQSLDKPLSPALRPDKSRVVIGTNHDGESLVFYVSRDQADAWQRKLFKRFITDMRNRGVTLSVSCGSSSWKL
jgi:hypothetical protein